MTLEQKQQTLTTALTELKDVLKNADFDNDYSTDMISEDVVLRAEGEAYEAYSERLSFVFDIISGVGAEDSDNLTEEEASEMVIELENALENLQVPETLEQKREAINIAIAELNEYFENGDHEATNEIKQYWINEDNTYNVDLFRGHYFNVTNSELTEGQQLYIWDLIESASCFENETIDHDLIDFIPTMLDNELVELEPA